MKFPPPLRFGIASAGLALLGLQLASCGGGSSPSNNMIPPPTSANNVQPVVVNSGSAGNYANGIFTSVTVCVPSTSNCQTIDSILVDTGSYGLRLLSSAGGGALTLSLPPQTSNGNSIGECAGFVSAFTWGPIKTADITISGEHAGNVPIQVVDPTFSMVPEPCKNGGVPENDTLQTLGANGILGIGPFAQDCGSQCTLIGMSNPNWYYSCAGNSCQVIPMALSQQVQNPVPLFATDNNGVIVELPAAANPIPTLTGSLVFGIGTQSNNTLGGSSIFPIDASGNFSTNYKGQTYPAFIDSGSNAYFFLDSTTTGIPTCPSNAGFYCPALTASLSATTSSSSVSETINFSVANADTLFSNSTSAVFNTLGGPNSGMFDWGLPFFFGRNVYTAIESKSTPGGVGPYWAY